MRKIIVIFIILTAMVISISIAFVLYYNQKKAIYYAEHSLLYKYCIDNYNANNRNFLYNKFLSTVAQKDDTLYNLIKKEKIVFLPYHGFIWKRSQNIKNYIDNNQYTFSKFLFSDKNIYIQKDVEAPITSYKPSVIYKYKSNIFIEDTLFNDKLLRNKYAEIINCPLQNFNAYLNNKKIEDLNALILMQTNKIYFIYSDFDKESEEIIAQILKDNYTSTKDTFIVKINYYNLKDAECVYIK